MWQYNYSDELYHRDHKYIDRYKGKGGRWVYVYKNKIKKGIETNKRVEAEEDGWGTATLNDEYAKKNGGKNGGTYSFDSKSNSSLKRTKENEQGHITYNVKNGKQLFDSYSENTKITKHSPNEFGNTATVERTADVTYGYLHRATNQIEKGKKALEKFLNKRF